MPEIARFLVSATATAADPISAIGYIVAGVVGKRLWHAAVGGAGWAFAMDLFVRVVDPGYSGNFLVHRIFGGLVVSMAVFGAKRLLRRKREAGTPPSVGL